MECIRMKARCRALGTAGIQERLELDPDAHRGSGCDFRWSAASKKVGSAWLEGEYFTRSAEDIPSPLLGLRTAGPSCIHGPLGWLQSAQDSVGEMPSSCGGARAALRSRVSSTSCSAVSDKMAQCTAPASPNVLDTQSRNSDHPRARGGEGGRSAVPILRASSRVAESRPGASAQPKLKPPRDFFALTTGPAAQVCIRTSRRDAKDIRTRSTLLPDSHHLQDLSLNQHRNICSSTHLAYAPTCAPSPGASHCPIHTIYDEHDRSSSTRPCDTRTHRHSLKQRELHHVKAVKLFSALVSAVSTLRSKPATPTQQTRRDIETSSAASPESHAPSLNMAVTPRSRTASANASPSKSNGRKQPAKVAIDFSDEDDSAGTPSRKTGKAQAKANAKEPIEIADDDDDDDEDGDEDDDAEEEYEIEVVQGHRQKKGKEAVSGFLSSRYPVAFRTTAQQRARADRN
ncbi:hypothetical protein L1887_51498 [Cichorium endivia]|nr:hypothetical protein L1887_51498 [Cichorium endivia]